MRNIILAIIKIISSSAIVKLCLGVLFIIAYMFGNNPIVWVLGIIVTAYIVIDFWKNNTDFWPVIWKGVLCGIVFFIIWCGIAGIDFILNT